MPSRNPQNLTIFGVVSESVLVFLAHWRRHFVLSFILALPLATLAVIGYFDPISTYFAASQTENGAPAPISRAVLLRGVSMAALMLLLSGIYASVWWRGIFQGRAAEGEPQWLGTVSLILTKMVIFTGLLLGAAMGLSLIGGLVALVLSPVVGVAAGGGFIAYILSFIVQLFLLGMGMRLGLALPPAVWGEDIPFAKAWAAGRGHLTTLTAVAIVLGMPALLISLLIAGLFAQGVVGAGPWAGFVSGLLLSPINFLVHALLLTALAVAFRQLRQAGRV